MPTSGRSPRPSPAAVRRRRATAVAGLVVVLAALGLAIAAVAGGGRGGSARARDGSTRVASTTRRTTTSTTTRARRHRPPLPHAPFRVAKISLTLVEPASSTSDPAAGARELPTIVRYPVVRRNLLGRMGAFPLIVFSQGFDEPAEAYAGLLRAWAAAGFVVADPTYPRTDPAAAGGVDRNDIVNHPGDLRYVIGALASVAGRPSSPLHGVLNPHEVTVAGQSDGGDVSLAVAANSCCQDPAVRAAVILSGAELSWLGGSYFTGHTVPLLVVQGSADTINPPPCSAQIYDHAPRPKYYLDILGGQHLPPYIYPGSERSGIVRVVVAFLHSYLQRRHSELRRLDAQGALGGSLRLSSGPVAPTPQGFCPDAP